MDRMRAAGAPLIALGLLGACGRIGFGLEARGDLTDAGPGGDGDVAIDAPAACAFTCVDDYAGMSTTCGAGPITFALFSPGDPHVLRADLAGLTSLEATIEVCDPVGPVFQIADSATNKRVKGDTGEASNDAHVLLLDSTLEFHRSDYGVGSDLNVGFVPATGCSTRTITVADRLVQAPPTLAITEDAALRLDPPADAEGTPDRLWYLGINRTVNIGAPDEGSGLVRVTFCLR